MKCGQCKWEIDDALIKVKVYVPNGKTDENELNNYDMKNIFVCSVCYAHTRYKEYEEYE
tara:strand:- start:336 stop:512 length:177 start_codon:yes stop_codon:yes gene_type:complete